MQRCSVAESIRQSIDHLRCSFAQVVRPAEPFEAIYKSGAKVECIKVLRGFVVEWKCMVIVMPALAECTRRHETVFPRYYIPVIKVYTFK